MGFLNQATEDISASSHLMCRKSSTGIISHEIFVKSENYHIFDHLVKLCGLSLYLNLMVKL
jgi:hypothetical protein